MSWFPSLGFRRRRSELQEEIDAHLQMAIADRVARGEPQQAARQAVIREFGNVPLVLDVTHSMSQWSWFEQLIQDFRYAFRTIYRSPFFAATVIGTMGLGIAATAAMFTVVDHVLLQPVSYRDSGQVVAILAGTGKEVGGQYLAPWLDIREWMSRSRSFEQIAFWGRIGGRNYLEESASALQIDGIRVSPNLFLTLGVKPWLGRGFLPLPPSFSSDTNSGTIVLSYPVWRTAFAGDTRILGQLVTINKTAYTVIGIMPPGFAFPVADGGLGQVWVSAQLGKDDQTRSLDAMSYEAIGRLRKGQTLASARVEMETIQKTLAPQYTDSRTREEHSTVTLRRYGDSIVGSSLREALLALLGASGALWLIASFNVTNLFLARGTAHQREIAMRQALGASRWRVMRQMIVESFMFSGAAAMLGTCAAVGSLKLLTHALQTHLPIAVPARPDFHILMGLLGLTVVSALVSGAWPTLLAVRAPIEPVLKQGGVQAGTGRRQHRMRSMLVTLEMALSLTLLVTCGLLLRTIYTLQHVPLGFSTDHIIVANLDIPSFRFVDRDMTETLYGPLLERVKLLPGTQAAGLISQVPLGHTFALKITLRVNGKAFPTYFKAVSPSVQDVFGIRMAAGRFFDAQDTPTSQTAIVVNEAFARLYSPDSHNPAEVLGKKLFSSDRGAPKGKSGESAMIVGIVADERQQSVGNPAQPEIDVCIPQITPTNMFYYPTEGVAMDLAVRTNRPIADMIPELRAALRQASPELASATITTMDQIVEDSYGDQRFAAQLLEIFGGAALLLCVAGLYGLLTYIVMQRKREIGVRIALGARRGNLLWLVMRQASGMLVVGIIAGSGLALASSRLARGYLYGVSTHDSLTIAGSVILLFLSGMLAAYLPARRAARVDPMEALRAE